MMTICQSYSCLMACGFLLGKKDFVIKDIIVWISLNLKVNTSRFSQFQVFLSFDHSSLGTTIIFL